jgi:hypothetical protein
MARLLPLHVWQCGGNAVQNAFDVDVDRAVPVVDFPSLERRVRHHARIVQNHVDAAVLLDGRIDERLELRGINHLGDTRGRLAALPSNLLD